MPNYKITLEYDGTNYVGWQRQENGPSVQQLVEEAIEKLSKQKIILLKLGGIPVYRNKSKGLIKGAIE